MDVVGNSKDERRTRVLAGKNATPIPHYGGGLTTPLITSVNISCRRPPKIETKDGSLVLKAGEDGDIVFEPDAGHQVRIGSLVLVRSFSANHDHDHDHNRRRHGHRHHYLLILLLLLFSNFFLFFYSLFLFFFTLFLFLLF